jgi:hypothetical protein
MSSVEPKVEAAGIGICESFRSRHPACSTRGGGPAAPLPLAGSGSPGPGVFRDVRGVGQVPLPASVGVHDEDVGGAVGGIVALADETISVRPATIWDRGRGAR